MMDVLFVWNAIIVGPYGTPCEGWISSSNSDWVLSVYALMVPHLFWLWVMLPWWIACGVYNLQLKFGVDYPAKPPQVLFKSEIFYQMVCS